MSLARLATLVVFAGAPPRRDSCGHSLTPRARDHRPRSRPPSRASRSASPTRRAATTTRWRRLGRSPKTWAKRPLAVLSTAARSSSRPRACVLLLPLSVELDLDTAALTGNEELSTVRWTDRHGHQHHLGPELLLRGRPDRARRVRAPSHACPPVLRRSALLSQVAVQVCSLRWRRRIGLCGLQQHGPSRRPCVFSRRTPFSGCDGT